MLCSLIMFAIIQGIYILRQDEGESEDMEYYYEDDFDYDIEGEDYYGGQE